MFDVLLVGLGGIDAWKRINVDRDANFARGSKIREVWQAFGDARELSVGSNVSEWNEATNLVITHKAGAQIMGDWAQGEFSVAGYTAGNEYDCLPGLGINEVLSTGGDAFYFPATDDADLARAQKKMASMMVSKDVQVGFNLAKGSLPIRADVDLSAANLCMKKGLKILDNLDKRPFRRGDQLLDAGHARPDGRPHRRVLGRHQHHACRSAGALGLTFLLLPTKAGGSSLRTLCVVSASQRSSFLKGGTVPVLKPVLPLGILSQRLGEKHGFNYRKPPRPRRADRPAGWLGLQLLAAAPQLDGEGRFAGRWSSPPWWCSSAVYPVVDFLFLHQVQVAAGRKIRRLRPVRAAVQTPSAGWSSVENIAIFGICSLVFSLVIGFLLAALLDQKIRFENTFRTIFLYPFALSFIITGLVWQWILNPEFRHPAGWSGPSASRSSSSIRCVIRTSSSTAC